jgi:hypothetical protein
MKPIDTLCEYNSQLLFQQVVHIVTTVLQAVEYVSNFNAYIDVCAIATAALYSLQTFNFKRNNRSLARNSRENPRDQK